MEIGYHRINAMGYLFSPTILRLVVSWSGLQHHLLPILCHQPNLNSGPQTLALICSSQFSGQYYLVRSNGREADLPR